MESTTTSHPPLSSGLSNGGLTTFLTSRISPESSLYPYLNKLTPKTNNIAAALVTIIYVKIVMEVGMLIRIKFDMPEISRKFIHICACSYVVFWPLFDVEHWGWRLNATVPVVMSFRLLYKGAILKDPEDHDVRSMSRTSSPYELLYGPLQLTIIMSYTGLTKFMNKNGIIVMGAFVGDWLAALIGVHYGKHKFTVPLGGQKSIEGSFGCVLGTMAGIAFYLYMVGMEIEEWRTLLAYGVVSAVVEGTAWREWDNAFLALAMEFSAKRLPGLMS